MIAYYSLPVALLMFSPHKRTHLRMFCVVSIGWQQWTVLSFANVWSWSSSIDPLPCTRHASYDEKVSSWEKASNSFRLSYCERGRNHFWQPDAESLGVAISATQWSHQTTTAKRKSRTFKAYLKSIDIEQTQDFGNWRIGGASSQNAKLDFGSLAKSQGTTVAVSEGEFPKGR